jgi:hypothetical protein
MNARNRIKGPRALVVTVALLLASLVTGSRAEPQLYDIELVVFKNLITNDGGEVWPQEYTQGPMEAEALPAVEPEVTWLSKSQRHLDPHYYTLRASANWRPLAHYAWRQAVVDRERSAPVQLPAAGRREGGAYVDGSARVAVERYLHLYLDLWLHDPGARLTGQATGDHRPAGAPVFRLREHRRMRSNELHYFDNPRFGVLALITPYAPAGTDPGADGGQAQAVAEQPQ